MAKIHPTAIIDPSAVLGEDVEVGAYACVEGDVQIGDRTVLRPHAIVRRFTTLGKENHLDSFCVLGGNPQDFKFDPHSETFLRVGDNNVFREGVTVSRATTPGGETRVGNRTYWMTCAHVGHDSVIADDVIFINGAMVGGHCRIDRGAIISGNGHVHQFCWVGQKTMIQGLAGVTMHAPPYVICSGINGVVALNAVGIKRTPEFTRDDRAQIKEAFRIMYRSDLTPTKALEKMETCDWGAPADVFRVFVREALAAEGSFKRGIAPGWDRLSERREVEGKEY